jgi:hypothetical protein
MFTAARWAHSDAFAGLFFYANGILLQTGVFFFNQVLKTGIMISNTQFRLLKQGLL